jgi:outer membrane protein OmpA-like peptidoglycan-associated protein
LRGAAARAALGAALVAAGCAAPPPPAQVRGELFAVVPAADGHVGSVVVERGGDKRVIDTAYGAQRVMPDGSVQASQMDAGQVRERFGDTLQALPGRPTSFTLYFLEGRDELTAESRAELDKVFAELRRRPLPDIMVIGHTDTVGGLAYNDKLSLARAERLREMMVTLGLPADRIQAAGRGKRELLVTTDENVPEPRNRRVEISVR